MTEPRWLDADELDDWMQLRRLLTLLPARLASDLAGSGVSMTDYEVLSTLSEQRDRRVELKHLAEKMQWSRSRLSHHAARMEARGLIVREPSPGDARGSIYCLTDDGLALLESVAPRHVASVRARLLDHLSGDELRTLGALSRRIADLGG